MKATYPVYGSDLAELIEKAKAVAAGLTESSGPDLIKRYSIDLDISPVITRYGEEAPSLWTAEVTCRIDWAD